MQLLTNHIMEICCCFIIVFSARKTRLFFSLNVPCWRELLFLRGLGSVSKVPHDFSGPKSKARVLTSKTVHFVFLNDGFTILSAKRLNLRS